MKKYTQLLILLAVTFSPNTNLFANGSGWKIAIIDTGLMGNHPNISSRINEQLCWSENDDKTDDSTTAETGYVHYDIASTCAGGVKSNFTSPNAGTVPRKTKHNFSDVYDYHYFGARHGSTVLSEAKFLASGAQFIVVNNSYYNKDNETFNSNGDVKDCGYHGPNAGSSTFPDSRKPSDLVGCYDPSDAEKQPSIINSITSRGNVAAINYSANKAESCNNNNAIFRDLKNANIAFVASAGNEGVAGIVKYPACNPHVISVGALNSNNNLTVAPSTSLQGKIDFFAVGIGYDYLTGAGSSAVTSYAAPKVAAAFAVMKSSDSFATLDEMKFALAYAAPNCIQHRGECVPIVTSQSIEDAADCLKFGTCMPSLPPGGDGIDYEDSGQYGNIYGDDSNNYVLEVDFSDFATGASAKTSNFSKSSETITNAALASSITIPSKRDVVLSFDAKMASNSSNGFRVYVNDIKRASTGNFRNEKSFEYVFNKSYFSSGNNIIRIEPVYSSRFWGLSNIRADFTPVVELTLNQVDSNEYGSEENPERPTGMRATFNLDNTDNDVLFAVTGWDISASTEVAIFMNGIAYGHLSQGSSSQNNSGDFFTFEKDDLAEGENIIEFVQKDGGNRWAVTNMLVTANSQSSASLTLGTTDTTQYGRTYGTNQNLFQLNASFSPQTQHDHKISWQAFDIESGSLEVYLNNIRIKSVRATSNNSHGLTESVTLAWRLFQTGSNTLSFRAKVEGTDNRWGVTNLLVKTSDVIDLEEPSNLNKDYGYYEKVSGGTPAGWTRAYSAEDYQSRLYATFINSGRDKTVTFRGWDIDSPTEMAVYLNGTFLQYATSAGASSIYSPVDRITIPADNMVSGMNTLSFRLADSFSGFQNEKWGINFDGLRGQVIIAPIIMLLLDDM